MKKCYACQETKDFLFFYKNASRKDGFSNTCKICMKIFSAKYRVENKEKIEKYMKKNNEKIKNYKREYREKNKDKICKQMKTYYKKNKDKIINKVRTYRNTCKQEIKEKRKEYAKKYESKNIEKLREMRRKYYKDRAKKDPMYKFKKTLSANILKVFRRKKCKKNSRTQKILGCNYETAFNHLKHTFEQNYKIPLHEAKEELHIDHITPLSFAKTEEELIKLNHYTNLQYLYASDNLKKSDKLDWELSHETL